MAAVDRGRVVAAIAIVAVGCGASPPTASRAQAPTTPPPRPAPVATDNATDSDRVVIEIKGSRRSRESPTATWVNFDSAGGRFGVRMPHWPNEMTESRQLGTWPFWSITAHEFGCRTESPTARVFKVRYVDLPVGADPELLLDGAVKNAAVLYVDGSLGTAAVPMNGRVTVAKPVMVNGNRGRDVRVEAGTEPHRFVVRERYVLVGRRMYVAAVATSSSEADAPFVLEFLKSFEIRALPLTVVPERWVRFSPAEGRFEAVFPQSPVATVQSLTSPGGVVTTAHVFEGTDRLDWSFMVWFAESPDVIDEKIDEGLNRVLDSSPKVGGFIENRSVTVDGHPGREAVWEAPNGMIVRQRVALAWHKRLYTVWVASPKPDAKSPDVARFLDSFKIRP